MKHFLATTSVLDVVGKISPPVNNPFYTQNANASLGNLIGTAIRLFYFVAALAALLYLLLGAYDWISSSGEKEKLQKAQNKIQSAVIGLILAVVALVVVATLEQVVLKNAFCIGLTCEIKLPTF